MTAEFTVGERPELWVLAIRSTAKRVYVNLHNPADKAMTESHIVALDWDGSVKGVYAVPMAVGPFAVDDNDSRLYFYPAGDHDSIYSFAL